MNIEELIWYDDIVEKLQKKHGVRKHEVRQLLASRPQFRKVERGHRAGEDVYAALGQTLEGRYLIAYFIYKLNRQCIVLSARDMTSGERKMFMKKKTSISRATDYGKIAEFWDSEDLSKHWGETEPAEFEVDIKSEISYYAVDSDLSEKIQEIARRHGVSADTLLKIWLQEKIEEQKV